LLFFFVLSFVTSLVFILIFFQAGFVIVKFYASCMQITVDHNALLNAFILSVTEYFFRAAL